MVTKDVDNEEYMVISSSVYCRRRLLYLLHEIWMEKGLEGMTDTEKYLCTLNLLLSRVIGCS